MWWPHQRMPKSLFHPLFELEHNITSAIMGMNVHTNQTHIAQHVGWTYKQRQNAGVLITHYTTVQISTYKPAFWVPLVA